MPGLEAGPHTLKIEGVDQRTYGFTSDCLEINLSAGLNDVILILKLLAGEDVGKQAEKDYCFVETEEQFSFLETNGCDVIQGYYFSKPLEPQDLADYVKDLDKKNKAARHI